MSQIPSFQHLSCDDLLLFSALCDSEWDIFGFLTVAHKKIRHFKTFKRL